MEDKDKEIRQWSELSDEERKALIDSLLLSEQKNQPDQERAQLTDHHGNFTGREVFLALFGLPAESNPAALSKFPFVTISLIVICFIASFYFFFHNPEMAGVLAFIPADAFRFGGLNFITCFFVHGGLMHLLSNMYALFVFGDNVEDDLGHSKYVLLLALATLGGSILSWLSTTMDPTPHVGASGGIFGVMVYYLLKFPKARFTYLFFFRFYRVPAAVVLMLYLFLQFTGAIQQVYGVGNVDYLAHLGGGALGFLFWLLHRNR